jgi:hypothetical protein
MEESRKVPASEPNQPAVTPAQIAAVLIAGIPAVANLLVAFGVYSVSHAQQAALSDALTWLGVVAGVMIAADAGLRSARNHARAKIAAAAARAAARGTIDQGTPSAVDYPDPEPPGPEDAKAASRLANPALDDPGPEPLERHTHLGD